MEYVDFDFGGYDNFTMVSVTYQVARLQHGRDPEVIACVGCSNLLLLCGTCYAVLTMPYYLAVMLLLVCATACDSAEPATEEPSPLVALRDVANFPVGVALQSRRLSSPPHAELTRHVFSSLTAEYEMKMVPLAAGPGAFNWDPADRLVEFATSNGMQVHGHALVWHQTTPAWLESFGGTDEQFEAAVKDYITTVVSRYKDSVRSWDVVNEAVEDGTGALRNSVFRRRMGDDYIVRLFEYARMADPDALLFYNDYGTTWDTNKQAGVLALVDRLRTSAAGIDGVGLQMHVTYTFPDLTSITAAMDEIVKRGLLVHISELDVRVNPEGDLSVLTPERSQAQKRRVADIVGAFQALPPDNRYAITVWGLLDSESWLIDFWGNPEWGLLFDDSFHPKPAYYGFLEALQ